MNDANDTATTSAAPAQAAPAPTEPAPPPAPAEAAPEAGPQPEPAPEPELEIAVEEDQGEAIAALEQRLVDEHDRLLRTAAELDNVRKRARRDVEDAALRGRGEVLSELLPAMDAIDLALKNADGATPAKAMIDGVEMVRRQFLSSMARFGLKPIECVGAPFDPNFHEAVAQIPHPSAPVGSVVEELRRGYVLGPRLLRATLVVVSAGPPAAAVEAPAAAPPESAGTGEAPPEATGTGEGEEGANG